MLWRYEEGIEDYENERRQGRRHKYRERGHFEPLGRVAEPEVGLEALFFVDPRISVVRGIDSVDSLTTLLRVEEAMAQIMRYRRKSNETVSCISFLGRYSIPTSPRGPETENHKSSAVSAQPRKD